MDKYPKYKRNSYNSRAKQNKTKQTAPPPKKKWAKDLKIHFSKRHTNYQQIHEKMFNITNH